MSFERPSRALRAVVLLIVVGALLLLISLQAFGHHDVTLDYAVLFPLLLLEILNVASSHWPVTNANDVVANRTPTLTPLLQRPPPSAIA